jgi:tripartite-type tricarboxylate transporter receptor subunit TctC
MFKNLLHASLVATLALGAGLAFAQSGYPAKPIRLIVGFTAGGVTDIVARASGQKLSELLGQPVVVENLPGAAGIIAAERVAKAPPDGYTLLLASNGPFAINPSLYAKLSYDPLKDYALVSMLATVPFVVVVNPVVPAHNLKQLVTLAKARRNLSYASAGVGSTAHLAGEYLKSFAGFDALHVPYKGSTPALTDLMGGQVDMMVEAVPSALAFIRSNKLRALAVTAKTRAASLSAVPTTAEAGYRGFEVGSWFGLAAPAGTPRDVVLRLNQALASGIASPDLRERLLSQGAEPAASSPEAFGTLLRDEIGRWAKVIRSAGIRAE